MGYGDLLFRDGLVENAGSWIVLTHQIQNLSWTWRGIKSLLLKCDCKDFLGCRKYHQHRNLATIGIRESICVEFCKLFGHVIRVNYTTRWNTRIMFNYMLFTYIIQVF